jgi:hypothetical protein
VTCIATLSNAKRRLNLTLVYVPLFDLSETRGPRLGDNTSSGKLPSNSLGRSLGGLSSPMGSRGQGSLKLASVWSFPSAMGTGTPPESLRCLDSAPTRSKAGCLTPIRVSSSSLALAALLGQARSRICRISSLKTTLEARIMLLLALRRR